MNLHIFATTSVRGPGQNAPPSASADPVSMDGAYVSDGESLRVVRQLFETLVTTGLVVLAGEVTVRVAFDDFGGRTVYHCHILDHEDNGMMGIVEAG